MPEETYSELKIEDVASLVRVEKDMGPLSPVRKDLYPAMIALQEKITKECEKRDVESIEYDFAVDRKKKLLSNIKQVVEYRMGKIASMAVRSAMGSLNSVDNLPPEERIYYDEVLEASKKLWNAPLKKKPKVRTPELVIDEPPVTAPSISRDEVRVDPVPEIVRAEPVPEPAASPFIPDLPEEMPGPDDMGDIYIPEEELGEPVSATPVEIPPIPEEELGEPVAAEPAPAEAEPVEEEELNPFADNDELETIRVIETVPPFAGTERNYVLRKDEVVSLPKSLASILVGRNLAIRLNI